MTKKVTFGSEMLFQDMQCAVYSVLFSKKKVYHAYKTFNTWLIIVTAKIV